MGVTSVLSCLDQALMYEAVLKSKRQKYLDMWKHNAIIKVLLFVN